MNGPAAASAIDASRSKTVEPSPSDGSMAAGGLLQFISFAIGEEQYGVDITAVREIKGWSQITPLPRQPAYIRGVLNLRGTMVPIIDLRCRFDQGTTEATPLHVIIVVRIGANDIGLLADRVLDIVTTKALQIQLVPRVAQAARRDFLSGLVTNESGMIALIDLSHLLNVSVGEGAEIAAAIGRGPDGTSVAADQADVTIQPRAPFGPLPPA